MFNPTFPQTDNQTMLEESLGRYLRDKYSFIERAESKQSALGFDRTHWDFFAEMGILSLSVDEEAGGLGGSLGDVMLVSRLMGKSLMLEPFVECSVGATKLIASSVVCAERDELLSSIMQGEQRVGLAHDEYAFDPTKQDLSTRLGNRDGGWYLNGVKRMIVALPTLDSLVVSAQTDNDGLSLCLIPLSSEGVTLRSYPGIDGRIYGDVHFKDVVVSPSQLLGFADTGQALQSASTWIEACLCAEAVGIMSSLYETTVEYTQTRKQFGTPIASFQVIKHRLVDCYNAVYQSRHLLEALAFSGESQFDRALSTTIDFIVEHGAHIGHEAIQMHGGMGVTDELIVSHYHKRLTVILMTLGKDRFTGGRALAQYDDLEELVGTVPAFASLLPDEISVFQQEVGDFISENLSEQIRDDVRRQVMAFTEPHTTGAWLAQLQGKGWQAPLWPAALGGTGWSALERFIYEYESGRRDVPELVPMGFRYVGPVIAHFGSDWQKEYFLPKILSGEHYWCQGFSEPGAGSDLAALKTIAERDGDDYIINGTKIWTTHAHHANWLFCLARTDKTAPPQKSIGFFLIPLDTPGITVDAIPLMTGPREVNQVFLENVRIPAEYLVGDPCKGWEYTKFLLELERGGAVFCGRARSELLRIVEILHSCRTSFVNQPILRADIAKLARRLSALELLEYHHSSLLEEGAGVGVGGSITKLLASELRKDIAELQAHVVSLPGVEYHDQFLVEGTIDDSTMLTDLELTAIPRYLNIRAESIYGGSSEIQREIIAKSVLGVR
jgi:alkylation response protein AidB-like acyl-CoA dehydrogenase